MKHFEGNDPETQHTSELQSRQELADFAGSEIMLILHIYQYLKAMRKVLFIHNANIQCCYGFTLMDECRLLRELNSRQTLSLLLTPVTVEQGILKTV